MHTIHMKTIDIIMTKLTIQKGRSSTSILVQNWSRPISWSINLCFLLSNISLGWERLKYLCKQSIFYLLCTLNMVLLIWGRNGRWLFWLGSEHSCCIGLCADAGSSGGSRVRLWTRQWPVGCMCRRRTGTADGAGLRPAGRRLRRVYIPTWPSRHRGALLPTDWYVVRHSSRYDNFYFTTNGKSVTRLINTMSDNKQQAVSIFAT